MQPIPDDHRMSAFALSMVSRSAVSQLPDICNRRPPRKPVTNAESSSHTTPNPPPSRHVHTALLTPHEHHTFKGTPSETPQERGLSSPDRGPLVSHHPTVDPSSHTTPSLPGLLDNQDSEVRLCVASRLLIGIDYASAHFRFY